MRSQNTAERRAFAALVREIEKDDAALRNEQRNLHLASQKTDEMGDRHSAEVLAQLNGRERHVPPGTSLVVGRGEHRHDHQRVDPKDRPLQGFMFRYQPWKKPKRSKTEEREERRKRRGQRGEASTSPEGEEDAIIIDG